MRTVSFNDWLELLGLADTIADLIAGRLTLPDARQTVTDTKTEWPSVSQDFAAVLDQLEPFFAEVRDVIDQQQALIDDFNAAVSEFGESFMAPTDRLLNDDDLIEMSEIRRSILDRLAETRTMMEDVIDEIEALMDELDGLQGGLDDGDPFAAEEIEGALQELDALQGELEESGCLG